MNFDIYTKDPNGELINTNGNDFEENNRSPLQQFLSPNQENKNFSQLISDKDGKISQIITDEYEIIYGKWPENANELVLFTDHNNEIYTSRLYELGLLKAKDYRDILNKLDNNEKFSIKTQNLDPKDIIGHEYKFVSLADYYQKENNSFVNVRDDGIKIDDIINKSVTAKIVAIARKISSDDNQANTQPIGYTEALTDKMIDHVNNTEIVKAQIANKDKNVFNNLPFIAKSDEDKKNSARDFLENLTDKDSLSFSAWIIKNKADISKKVQKQAEEDKKNIFKSKDFSNLPNNEGNNEKNLAKKEENQLAKYVLKENDPKTLIEIYEEFVAGNSYKKNLENLGLVSKNAPKEIDIYVENFENREKIKSLIDDYNTNKSKNEKINYTDYIGLITKSVTDIINAISYVLMAFVSVSLVVSSIMIGIITYISVLERTKEIGILRSIGASKSDIKKVFMAETFIIGLLSGLIGIGLTKLINIPITNLIRQLTNVDDIASYLPASAALILVIISISLTLIAGIIPSSIAAKKNPVEALREE